MFTYPRLLPKIQSKLSHDILTWLKQCKHKSLYFRNLHNKTLKAKTLWLIGVVFVYRQLRKTFYPIEDCMKLCLLLLSTEWHSLNQIHQLLCEECLELKSLKSYLMTFWNEITIEIVNILLTIAKIWCCCSTLKPEYQAKRTKMLDEQKWNKK